MMLTMIINIYTHRSADQAKVEALEYSSKSYCPPNTKEKDKITFATPTTPPHKRPPSPSPSRSRSRIRHPRNIPHPDPLPPLLSPPHKRPATVQSPQLSNVDCSSDYEVDMSKSIVVNPMYPPSTSSNPTTPSSVNTSNNSYTPRSNLDDYATKDPMYAPGGALGLDLKGGQTSGSEILDS